MNDYVWLTRDRSPGGCLSMFVDVWVKPPRMRRARGPSGLAIYWTDGSAEDVQERLEELTLEDARRLTNTGTIPDDVRQCVRVRHG